jgi:hypothetical protein
MTDSDLKGNVLSGVAVTYTRGSLVGRVLASADVTLTDVDSLGSCEGGGGGTIPPTPNPSNCGVDKVTGGGQIWVPSPDSNDPNATGIGRATFGFNAQPNKSGDDAKGHFNYVNHVTGLHVNGPVDDIQVIAIHLDGTPKTVQFSGSSQAHGKKPAYSYVVTVEDQGEPGTSDEFGITVTGGLNEERSQRVIENGNIQFHMRDCGSTDHDHGSAGHDLGCKDNDHGSKGDDHGSKDKGHGSKDNDHGSKGKDHASKDKGHGHSDEHGDRHADRR